MFLLCRTFMRLIYVTLNRGQVRANTVCRHWPRACFVRQLVHGPPNGVQLPLHGLVRIKRHVKNSAVRPRASSRKQARNLQFTCWRPRNARVCLKNRTGRITVCCGRHGFGVAPRSWAAICLTGSHAGRFIFNHRSRHKVQGTIAVAQFRRIPETSALSSKSSRCCVRPWNLPMIDKGGFW